MRAARILAGFVLGAAGLAVAVTLASSGEPDERRVTATMSSSSFLIAGSEIREAGRKIGQVRDVTATRDGRARIELRLDEGAWPLPVGTRIRVRMGSTVAYSGRWLELARPSGAATATIPAGGTIPPQHARATVEFDEVFDIFDAPTRMNLRRTVDASGRALREARRPLERALDATPAALEEVNGVLEETGGDTRLLTDLVRSTDRLSTAIATARPGIDAVLAGAARTFGATEAEAAELRRTLRALPATLTTTRRVLRRADGTLTEVAVLADRLAPGITEVRATAAPLTRVLGSVRTLGPDLRSTLATARRGAPALATALDDARPLLPRVRDVAEEGARQAQCIRPYTPEIAGLASTWSGFVGNADRKDKYARIQVESMIVPNATPLTSAQLTKALPGLGVSFPRPPGENAGQPWFLPSCGVGPEVNDPEADPESRPLGATRKGAR